MPRREGLPEAVAEADPRRLPQRGLLRAARVRRRGGRADVLLEECLRALPRSGGAARRPASGADDGRPDPVQAGCLVEAERGPEGDVEERLHHRREASPRGEETASPEARSPLHAAPPAELLRLGHAAAGQYIQPAAGGAGRPQGEDDARHPSAGARAPRNQRHSPHVHGSRCGARRDRSAHRRREGDGRLPPERTQDAVQLRNAGPPLDRKLLQADHACDGAERGRLAVLDVLRTARASHHHPGVPGQERVLGRPQLRRRGRRDDEPPRRDRQLREHDLRPADREGRRGERHGDGAPARDHDSRAGSSSRPVPSRSARSGSRHSR